MKPLEESKRRAIEMLTLGSKSRSEVAEALGVSVQTVNGWSCSPRFRDELESWRAGAQADAITLAQSRRFIIEELARRLANKPEDLNVRDLLSIHDRMTKESQTPTEVNHDVPSRPTAATQPLSTEEAERIWAERERAGRCAETGEADDSDKS